MTKRMVIAALALVGVFVALYLTLYKVGAIGELSCTVGSCTTVQSSKWATFLGLPVAAWGVGFYLSVLAVTLVGLQDRFIDSRPIALFLVVSSGIGVAFSLWLTYLEAFVIRAWCQWCVVSAIIVVCIFIASILEMRELSVEREADM
jgi:uncharacterized membrane protein